jgi:MFS family permease
MKHVGYIMAVWGATTMLAAALLGYAAKFTGRKFLFGFAFFVDLAILTLLLFWTPHTGSYAVMICVVALMGLVDGIWSVQCHGK